MPKAIFLDMDDTLIATNVLYENAVAHLRGFMAHFGHPPEKVQDTFNRIDKDMYKLHGLSIERMPSSFAAVLKDLAPEQAGESNTAVVRGFASSIFNTVANVKPGVPEAISQLAAEGYELHIITSGNDKVQAARFSHLPFRDKIKSLHVVPSKDKAVFETALRKTGLRPDEALMIGDSMKSDILPSTAAGMKAILIEPQPGVPGFFHAAQDNQPTLPEGARLCHSLIEAARTIIEDDRPAPTTRKAPGRNMSP